MGNPEVKKMSNKPHLYPYCNREFKNIFDYPKISIISFQMLPIPEAMDYHSARAAKKRGKLHKTILQTHPVLCGVV